MYTKNKEQCFMVFESAFSAGDVQKYTWIQNETNEQKNKKNAPTQDALHHFRSAVMVRRPLASTDAASIFMTHYTYITNTHAAQNEKQIYQKYKTGTRQIRFRYDTMMQFAGVIFNSLDIKNTLHIYFIYKTNIIQLQLKKKTARTHTIMNKLYSWW